MVLTDITVVTMYKLYWLIEARTYREIIIKIIINLNALIWLLSRRKTWTAVSCLRLLWSGPEWEPVQGRTGDPALPAPLSSRVSLLQCSIFSVNRNNYTKDAMFAYCKLITNFKSTTSEMPTPLCFDRETDFNSEFPSIPPWSKSIPT